MSAGSAGPLAWEPDEEDLAFYAVYGPWEPLDRAGVAELLDGFEAPWWVVGGWAIEAFTGVVRAHEDIDVVIFGRDVAAFRRQVGDRYHLWSNAGGTFRILDDAHPEPLDPLSQIWARRDAGSPWVLDCILAADQDGRWVSKRDPDHVADLEDVTWVGPDGLRYQNPDVVLRHKARQARRKDEVDLRSTWPLLAPDRQHWLREAVLRSDPAHPWRDLMTVGA